MKPTKDPAGSPEAFRRFLAWLDQGNDSRGETYLEIRRRLVCRARRDSRRSRPRRQTEFFRDR